MRAVALDLLVRRDGAEDDLGELSSWEGLIGDATAAVHQSAEESISGERDNAAYPTTSSGFFTIAMDRCVRSYTKRAMYSFGILGSCF